MCPDAFSHTLMRPTACSLIRASRAVNSKALPPYQMATPWGQPEPVTRHHHADTAGVGSRGQACGAGIWSPDHASHKYTSPRETEPDLDQVRHLYHIMAMHLCEWCKPGVGGWGSGGVKSQPAEHGKGGHEIRSV